MRLTRLASACGAGQRDQAEAELRAWRRRADCPPGVRVLLASLLARSGQWIEARRVLRPEPWAAGGEPDAIEAATRFAARCADGLWESTPVSAHDSLPPRPDAATRWLGLLDALSPRQREALDTAEADRLRGALCHRPELVEAVTAALRQAPQPRRLRVVRRAVTPLAEQAVRGAAAVTLHLAAADLAELAGDTDAAWRWAQRALDAEPGSPAAALRLARLAEAGTAAQKQTACTALRRVCRGRPGLPDARAALIRLERKAGQTSVARRRLTRWLQREPHSSLARRLERELRP